MTQASLGQLLEAVAGATSVLIVPHNDPDPDAIASAVGLRYLLAQAANLPAQILYAGIIGRAENKALVRYLGRPLRQLAPADLKQATHIALVDTQPGAGNNPLPIGQRPAIVVDHHDWREESAKAAFSDVRSDVGATSTMITEYLRSAGLEPPAPLATALFYGIKTDTMGLWRGAGMADMVAYQYLQPMVEIDGLSDIAGARLPSAYFQSFVQAFQSAQVYDSVVLAYVGPMAYPDLAAEIADLLSRLEGVQWVLCMGTYNDSLNLSVRSRSRRARAGQLVRAVVGDLGIAGGHGTMAGGHIQLHGAEPQALAQRLGARALEHLKIPSDVKGKQLV